MIPRTLLFKKAREVKGAVSLFADLVCGEEEDEERDNDEGAFAPRRRSPPMPQVLDAEFVVLNDGDKR